MAGATTKDEIVVMPPRLNAKASLTGLACLVMVFPPEDTTLLLGVGPGVPGRHAHDRLKDQKLQTKRTQVWVEKTSGGLSELL